MKDWLIVFAKEPIAGKVKTRLREHFSESGCVKLYKTFLKDTLKLVRGAGCLNKVLAYDAFGRQPKYLKRIARDFMFYKQKGEDLGERMNNAFRFAKKNGGKKIVIIGSDSPDLPINYLRQAFKRLDRSDIVLGPSYDGGYYLIGLKVPCAKIFQGVKWSSETVFKVTLKNSALLVKKVSVLKRWYDVDNYSDLILLKKGLKKDSRAAFWTRKFLGIQR